MKSNGLIRDHYVTSPEQWYKKYTSTSYRGFWKKFEHWLAEQGITWRGLLDQEPVHIRNLIDEYLLEVKQQYTTKSLKTVNTTIRSFLIANDITVPRSHITLRGDKPMNISRLTPDILRDTIISKSDLCDRSFLIFKFQSLQDNERMLWISNNAWSQIRPQLDDGGWTDARDKLWKDVLRIDMLCAR